MNPAATELDLGIAVQPDEQTCGPTALHAVYRFYGDAISAEQVAREVTFLPRGGTLAVYLGLHALARGYRATIYTLNVQIFDPTWFTPVPAPAPGGAPGSAPGDGDDGPGDGSAVGVAAADLCDKLRAQHALKGGGKLRRATRAYCEYLGRGGELRMADITLDLLGRTLRRGTPIIAGLSATWLYRSAREREDDCAEDDLAGEPLGHFVVLHGVDPIARRVRVADPYLHTPYPGSHHYTLDADRVIGAIYLGVVTYDAKLLIIEPPSAS